MPDTRQGNPPLPIYKHLTHQEQRVLELLAEGNTNKEIADQLTISMSTTKIHISNIFT